MFRRLDREGLLRIVDTHLHLIYLDKFSYPWLAGAPAINRQFTAETYFAEAAPLGIEAALHMEVDVDEPQMQQEAAFATRVHPNVVGAIAAARPEREDFPDYLERIAAIPGVRGLRRVLHVVPDAVAKAPRFAENLRRLSQFGLTFDLCVRADQLPIARKLVEDCPDVQFVLDHCGNPDVETKTYEPWRSEILAMARRPNVVAKISGIVAYGGPRWTVADLRPFAEHLVESFGWDRLVWGSDYPVCTTHASLTAWVEATHALLAGTSTDEQARLLHRNAERIYRLDPDGRRSVAHA